MYVLPWMLSAEMFLSILLYISALGHGTLLRQVVSPFSNLSRAWTCCRQEVTRRDKGEIRLWKGGNNSNVSPLIIVFVFFLIISLLYVVWKIVKCILQRLCFLVDDKSSIGIFSPQLDFSDSVRWPIYAPIFEIELITIILALQKLAPAYTTLLVFTDFRYV